MSRLGAKAVQIGFRLGSDLARLGAKVVQIGFRLGSDLARLGWAWSAEWFFVCVVVDDGAP